MPYQPTVTYITPDDETYYLVGPEGLVWDQPAIGEPHIIAARNDAERAAAAEHIARLLAMRLVPYGLPLDHTQRVALFGGPVLRDCRWVPWQDAPAPAGDPDDTLPTQAVVFGAEPPRRPAAADDLITIREAAQMLGITTQALSGRIARGDLAAYDDPAERNPQRRRRVRRADVQSLRSQPTE